MYIIGSSGSCGDVVVGGWREGVSKIGLILLFKKIHKIFSGWGGDRGFEKVGGDGGVGGDRRRWGGIAPEMKL